MKTYVVVGLVAALNGCATSAPDRAPDALAVSPVDTIRAHARVVRDQLRAGREALGLRERSEARTVDARPAEPPKLAGATPRLHETLAPPVNVPRPASRGHPARDAQLHEIRMDVTPEEMLTAQGGLQPRAAEALARMARMARDHGGEFTVTVPRTRIETAAAILAAAPDATILSTDEAEAFGLVVVTEGP